LDCLKFLTENGADINHRDIVNTCYLITEWHSCSASGCL
jgi:hypothetical protein